MKKILIVVGARPNFIKVTQFRLEANNFNNLHIEIMHTGQHYDEKMTSVFFDQFNLWPDYYLDVPSGNPGNQVGEIISKLSLHFETNRPDLVIVVGDVNSTLAAAIATNKAGILLAHLESGLRSNDRTMPEEINRILTDQLSDFCFVTERAGEMNLIAEGKKQDQIYNVGNTMIDAIVNYQEEIAESQILKKINVESGSYILLTVHRPAHVDTLANLKKLVRIVSELSTKYTVVFPLHPRTKVNLIEHAIFDELRSFKSTILMDPLSYFSFQKLLKHAHFVVTDSGGIQVEAWYYKVPCVTINRTTEHKMTRESGLNTLMEYNPKKIIDHITTHKRKSGNRSTINKGDATYKILSIIDEIISKNHHII